LPVSPPSISLIWFRTKIIGNSEVPYYAVSSSFFLIPPCWTPIAYSAPCSDLMFFPQRYRSRSWSVQNNWQTGRSNLISFIITQSALRQVHSQFQSAFYRPCYL